jgi:DNA adenine methylase
VLFNKPPSAIETVNDIDGDIVNFFKVLREQTDRLMDAIRLTPYARDVLDDAHENRGGGDDFDRAYRFAIRSRMGHGFKTYQKTGFKIDVYARERSYCVNAWNRMPDQLREAALRLKDVQIENIPAIKLIKKFNFDNVLIYADPPYLLNTRGGKQYRYEMNEQDHLDLLAALRDHRGMVILSGYPSEMYDRELRGWNKIVKKSYNRNSDPRTEILWCNFETNPTLFDYKS